jgi:hypothetical protein
MSRQHGFGYAGFLHAGEFEVKALGSVGEAFVVDAGQAEDGGVEVAGVDGILSDVIAEISSECRHDFGCN